MAKMIKLPSGISIDLEQGEIRTALGSGPIPISRSTRMSSYRVSSWGRFDDFIGSIGNWFADYSGNITSILSLILVACGGISFIVWLFSLGLLWGIVAGIFLGGIAYYALMVFVGVFIWIGNIGLGIVRYVFYSGTTFLIALVIIGTVISYSYYAASQRSTSRSSQVETAAATTTTTKYYCTAMTLNVRSEPNASGSVIGSLKKNQVVEAYEVTNGFAKIKYNSGFGYASIKYLKR